MRLRRGKRRRACVVGLDGVPFGLLQQLADRGVMRRVAHIISGGALRPMKAALPPVSSVSWSSFMTGANPGEHGIFGFTDVDPQTYQLRFPFLSDLAVSTFWDRLGQRGLRCCLLNQPATYPARPVPGALVSGFVAIELSKSVWPKEHLPALERMGYRIDVDSRVARESPDKLLDDLDATHALRRRAAAYFWEREEWDYFQLVVTGTDRLHHFLWRAVVDESDPRHDRAMVYYRAVDEAVGELWDRFHQGRSGDREGEGFFLLSDHGFCEVRWEVRLNEWLRAQGYLSYAKDDPATVADIAPEKTRALALDPGRIYLNTKGRFPRGCVDPDAAPALRDEIAAKFHALTHEGQPVASHVFPRDDIFTGPRTPLGPDLVVLTHPGFDPKGTTKAREVFGRTHFQGMHTWEEAFVWSAVELPEAPVIHDLAAVIVGWL